MGGVIGCFLSRMLQQAGATDSRPVILNPRSRYCPAAVIYYGATPTPPWPATRPALQWTTSLPLPAPVWTGQPLAPRPGPPPGMTGPRSLTAGPPTSWTQPPPPSSSPRTNYSRAGTGPPPSGRSLTADPACEICSGGPCGPVNHYHISTEHDRLVALHDRKQASFYCQTCRKSHETLSPMRRNVIFTSSTMINFWKNSKWNPPFHIDCEAIVGGTIKDSIRSFKIAYENNPTPINAVICVGINDILKGHSVEDICQDLHVFQSIIYDHSRHYKHTELGLGKNTVGICPLIKPPKCTTLNRVYQPPTLDKSKAIDRVNLQIKNINERFSETVPVYMNVLGIRTDKWGKTSHRLKAWREDQTGRKLHLSPDLKCSAANKMVDYFQKMPKV